ncbi:Oidioi.mRNA.OKI2018_I69.XSR.g16570.t1.cds [Oikopleura dioica]|uniref:Oidioi.mRNA.OKI2018_I69.XSR.g16570.t1.cds n=1 Tax=Oikopleura dioica TaxID=34765 RepID=A0ABN7SMW0_OIKDI|nr:Oidioi.mRNA.OKI2018_I69.XSR.g16570.t1.cds [Oikopleura dioica]
MDEFKEAFKTAMILASVTMGFCFVIFFYVVIVVGVFTDDRYSPDYPYVLPGELLCFMIQFAFLFFIINIYGVPCQCCSEESPCYTEPIFDVIVEPKMPIQPGFQIFNTENLSGVSIARSRSNSAHRSENLEPWIQPQQIQVHDPQPQFINIQPQAQLTNVQTQPRILQLPSGQQGFLLQPVAQQPTATTTVVNQEDQQNTNEPPSYSLLN